MKINIPPYLSNFYMIFTLFFFIWMLFFDSNDFVTQAKNSLQLRRMLGEKKYYLKEIERVKEDKKELSGNDKLLEKFARERYLMKKNGEEVFVIVTKEDEEKRERGKIK